MTVSNTTNKTSAAGNGVTTDFSFSYKIFEAANLEVYDILNSTSVATLKTLNTDYTVAINTSTEGGTVTFLSAPASGHTVFIKRVLAFDQDTDIPTESNFPEEAVENRFDYITMLAIQQKEEIARAIKLKNTSSLTDITIEEPVAGKMLVVNDDGDIIMSDEDFTDIQADLETVAGIAANVTTVAGISANVTTVAGIAANVTTVAGIAANVSAVAAIDTDVSAVAAIDTDVSAVAAIDTDVSAVAAIDTDVSAVAAIAADVTTVAGIAADVTAVVANLADILNAASFNFPTLGGSDAGKFLKVNATSDGYDLIASDNLTLLGNDITAGSLENSNAAIANLTLAASVSSNALTVAIKTQAGSNPSSTDIAKIGFRNSTLTNGGYNIRSITAATSVTASSGSTLGTSSGVASQVYVYALDNAGTIELGLSTTLYPDNSIQSTTAEGGAGASDSSGVIYSTTARSNVPVRLVGIVYSNQATAGTWASSPTQIDLVKNCPKLVDITRYQTGAFVAGTTSVPLDDTAPTGTEGALLMTAPTHYPKAPGNKLLVAYTFNGTSDSSSKYTAITLHKDSDSNVLDTAGHWVASGRGWVNLSSSYEMVAPSTTGIVFKVRGGTQDGSNLSMNGQGGSRYYGGTFLSSITIYEYKP